MKVTKAQLRSVIQETIRRKLDEALDPSTNGATMIVTKQQLQQLIDEEFERALDRRQGLHESKGRSALYECDVNELLVFAKAYSQLTPVVREQLDDVVVNPRTSDVNPRAVKLIGEHLGGLNEELDRIVEQAECVGMDQAPCMEDESVSMDEEDEDLDQVTPPGGQHVVRALKKKKGVKNPWAVAWAMKNKGQI